MAKDKNDVAFVSPMGTYRYPYLDEADFKFNEDGKFHTGLILEPEDADKVEEQCRKVFAEAFPKEKVKTLLIPVKEDDEGNRFITAGSKYAPKKYDAKKKPLPGPIGGGSKGRIAGLLHPFVKGANKGVTIYLYDAQVTKLVGRGSGGMMDALETEDEAEENEDNDTGNGDLDI